MRQDNDETGSGGVPPVRRRDGAGSPLLPDHARPQGADRLRASWGRATGCPPRLSLTRRFGVSRVVIRQALRILEEQGLIVRIKGKGTFVSERPSKRTPRRGSAAASRTSSISAPTRRSRSSSSAWSKPPPISPRSSATRRATTSSTCKRVRSRRAAARSPSWSITCRTRSAPRISLSDLTKEPLIVLIEKRAGVQIEWASQVFQAVAADEEMARAARGRHPDAAAQADPDRLLDRGQVVDLAHVFYRSDRYYHHGYLTRNRSADASFWNAWDSNGDALRPPLRAIRSS